MMKIRFLFTGNFEIEGRERHCLESEVMEVPESDAKRLIDGLCAQEVKRKEKKWQAEQ